MPRQKSFPLTSGLVAGYNAAYNFATLEGKRGIWLESGVEFILNRETAAQKRFAQEAKLTHIRYLSDYKEGSFGRSTGLLLDGLALLARAVIVVDQEGFVQYIQGVGR